MRFLFSSSRAQQLVFSRIIGFAVLVSCVAVIPSCATSKPVRTDVETVVGNLETYKNEYVELTAHVIDYEPDRGDTYRTLYFTIGLEPDEKIAVSAAGYTAEAISKASILVGEAFEAHGLLTVTGKLKVGKQQQSTAAELKLRSVEYEGRKIDVRQGRKTKPGFRVGGAVISPSIGIGVTFSP